MAQCWPGHLLSMFKAPRRRRRAGKKGEKGGRGEGGGMEHQTPCTTALPALQRLKLDSHNLKAA